jgi:hypothetical protein
VEIYAYHVGYCVGALVHLIVGVRLFALSARSAQPQDRLLSWAFLFWALSYLIYGVPWVWLRNEDLIPTLFTFGSMMSLHLGTIIFAFFTRAVFRSQERWAVWLLAGMVGCLIAGVAGSVWVGDWEGESPLSNPWWWLTRVGSAAPNVWMAAEGLAQYVKARRRRQLGLCAPRVCNRYLLWGLAGALWSVLEVVESAEYIVFESTGRWSDTLSALVGFLEAVPSVIIWLVFFPPVFYRNWIDRLATVADPAEEASPHGD